MGNQYDDDDEVDINDITVTLDLEDGTRVECAILTILEVEGKDYIALLPIDEETGDTDGEVYLYRYIETDEREPSLENILDDDEYEAVVDAFDEWLDSEEFDEIVDEEDLEDLEALDGEPEEE